jgi:Tfp pilus assembly protein FimT
MNYLQRNKGISVIELLFSIAILVILSSVSIAVFSNLSNAESLDRDVTIVANYIEKARTMSINSVDSLVHGVKIESNKVTVFKSSTFSSANSLESYDIPTKTVISDINLTGAATTFYFDKLTGVPSATGTITLSQSSGSESKTIIIYGTGIIDIQ